MSKTEAIHHYTPLLQSIALKIVGSIHDAEDIVQDTFEKWLSIDTSKIKNTKAYLIRSVSNNSIQFLQSLKKSVVGKSYHDQEEIELTDDPHGNHIFYFDLNAQLDHALSVLHRKLEPIEKYIFIMREAFNLEYEEMQHIFDKKVENLRQIVSRARQKLNDEKIRFKEDLPKSSISSSVLNAINYGHLSEVIQEFKNEMIDKLPHKKK